MRFSKWHGLGNDYLLVERADVGGPLTSAVVRRLCDGRRGIGADGVLEVLSAVDACAEIVIWNPDGSTAELSGNGARIAARWLALRSGEADGGRRGRRAEVQLPGCVPADWSSGAGRWGLSPSRSSSDGRSAQVEVIPVLIGNPHAVIDREPRREELLARGRSRAPSAFPGAHERPARTRGRCARDHRRVWERGGGRRLASGTSAPPRGGHGRERRCQSPVTVTLPGGDLEVTLDDRAERAPGRACPGDLPGEVAPERLGGRGRLGDRDYTATP